MSLRAMHSYDRKGLTETLVENVSESKWDSDKSCGLQPHSHLAITGKGFRAVATLQVAHVRARVLESDAPS